MPSDYKEICKNNIRRRGDEFDDIGRFISEQLYSDRTHFIYELLQNAEDALARRKRNNPKSNLPDSVKFVLFEDRLEFRHFGEEFNTEDVKGVSDILKGTKGGDSNQIGRFGIGFKSVYAFTSVPEIYSGEENFAIERYIRPRSADKISNMKKGETVFIFPFNHNDLSPEQAFQIIEEKLKVIGSRVLLFLKNISEIDWTINGQSKGQYIKDQIPYGKSVQKVTIIGQSGIDYEEETWIVFYEYVQSDKSTINGLIEIAFRLSEGRTSKKKRIIKIENSPLHVYFPTELETHLGFLIQGPYDTVASRSNIEENDWNRKLIDKTSSLLAETVLPILKKKGLLTSSFLEALPIRPDDFPENNIFRPIYDSIRIILENQEFLPTARGKHIAGKHAVLARAEDLVHLLDSKQLSMLLNNSHKLEWLTTDITETRIDLYQYLVGRKVHYWETGEEIDPLILMEFRPENLIDNLTNDFLNEQSVTWIIKLYTFFGKRPGLKETLIYKPIIRLENGNHVSPFNRDGTPNVYLPPDGDTEFPIVHPEITTNKDALEFLNMIGLTEPDLVAEVIENVIPKYHQADHKISLSEHKQDMEKILSAYSTDSTKSKQLLINKLKETAILHAKNEALNLKEYMVPYRLHFKDDALKMFFIGNEDIWFVSSVYDQSFYDLLKEIGVMDRLIITSREPGWNGHVELQNYHGSHKRGLNGYYPQFRIEGLEYALSNPTYEKSLYVWNIAKNFSDSIRGTIESSSRQTYENSRKKEEISEFGQLLINSAWLPGPDEKFYKPKDLGLDDLREEFERDERLADQLGMKKDIIAKYAKETEVSIEDINWIKQHPEEFNQLKAEISARQQKPAFPEKPSKNRGRRDKKVKKQLKDAPIKEYENKNRSVRISKEADAKEFLRIKYTNEDDQMICQICQEEMSFKKRNGDYYFEAVEMLSRNHYTKEHEAQSLALCPVCAAMFNEFIKDVEDAEQTLINDFLSTENFKVPLQLGELNTSIRFVETHFLDIKVILEE